MQTIKRLMTNLLSSKLSETKDFYTHLFDFEVDFDSDWFVHLISKKGQFELGILNGQSEIVPKELSASIGGFYLTLVVEDVDALYKQCEENDVPVLLPPEYTHYGQRRLLLKDPNGTVVDVSSPV